MKHHAGSSRGVRPGVDLYIGYVIEGHPYNLAAHSSKKGR